MSRLVLCPLALFVLSASAYAATPCDPPIVVAVGDLILQTDYETSSSTQPCFILQNGRDLSLNGKTIRCLATSCAAAVRIDTDIAPSFVKTAGRIEGPFLYGVDAINVTSLANTTVRDVTIDGAKNGVRKARTVEDVEIWLSATQPGTGVSNAETVVGSTISTLAPQGGNTGIFGVPMVTGNTILNMGTGMAFVNKASGNVIQSAFECIGIRWYPIPASDYARDNYIRCPGPNSTGITVYSAYGPGDSGAGPALESNLIRVEGTALKGLTGKARVFKNLIAVSPLTIPIDPGTATLTIDPDNMCNDPTYCTWPPLAPFSL